jgi:hypothetical protein
MFSGLTNFFGITHSISRISNVRFGSRLCKNSCQKKLVGHLVPILSHIASQVEWAIINLQCLHPFVARCPIPPKIFRVFTQPRPFGDGGRKAERTAALCLSGRFLDFGVSCR